MKTDDENFDDFLKSKMAEESFAFNEQDWQKASGMLDNARPKKKRLLFWVVTSTLFTGVVLAVVVYQISKQTPLLSANNRIATQHPLEQSPKTIRSATPVKQISKINQLAQPAVTVESASITNPKHPVAVKSKQVTPNLLHNKPSQSTVNTVGSITSKDANTYLQVPSITSKPLLIPTEKVAEFVTPSTAEQEISTLPWPELTNENLKRIELSTHWATALFEQTPLLTKDNHHFIQHPTKLTSTINGAPNLFIEGGLTWFNTKALNTSSLGAHLGLTYAFPLQGRFSMGVGLTYAQLNQTTGTRYYSTTSYGFGEQKKITGLKTVRLDYLELPLTIHYAISPKQGVFAGAALLYIVNSIDYKKNPEDITFDQKSSRYYQAYRPFDVQALLGYQYWVRSNIKISASYHYGLTDITDNAAFKRNDYNANKGFRLAVGYQLY